MVILLDISVTNSMYIIHIQHSLRLLLEEQMSNKDCFNLIACVPYPGSWRGGDHLWAEAGREARRGILVLAARAS